MTAKIVSGEGEKFLLQAFKDLEGKVGKVGWLDGKSYANGPPIAMVAAQNEYGNATLRIPPRPFMRPTIAEKQNAWSNLARRKAAQVLEGNGKAEDILEVVGLKAAGDIRKTISKLENPPLAHATIAARIRARNGEGIIGKLMKPLIDSGIMMNTLTNSVESE